MGLEPFSVGEINSRSEGKRRRDFDARMMGGKRVEKDSAVTIIQGIAEKKERNTNPVHKR